MMYDRVMRLSLWAGLVVALQALREHAEMVRVLGSYPRAAEV